MRADEFLARLQMAQTGKELVDLLVQASAIAPPMTCPFPPHPGTKVACMNNTPWVAAGTGGDVISGLLRDSDGQYWKVMWATAKEERIHKKEHDLYNFVYVY